MKKTLVLGASENPARYSHMAARSLANHQHATVLIGNKNGKIGEEIIMTGKPALEGIDTVTLYLNPQNQKDWYDYILDLKPKRIVFNPGTENPEFEKMAAEKGIYCERACTLVLLSLGAY